MQNSLGHVSWRDLLFEVSEWLKTVGRGLKKPWTLWCQWSTAGRRNNKSHCVFSLLHFEILEAVGPNDAFFSCTCSFVNRKPLDKIWTTWQCVQLTFWMAKRSLQLVLYIESTTTAELSACCLLSGICTSVFFSSLSLNNGYWRNIFFITYCEYSDSLQAHKLYENMSHCI